VAQSIDRDRIFGLLAEALNRHNCARNAPGVNR